MSHQRAMSPKHVSTIKMHFTGMTQVKIAEQIGYAPSTVCDIIKSEKGQRLLTLLRYVDSAMLGPSASHRTAILYRIVKRNEEKNPKVALQAIAELNKMDMNNHTKNLENVPTNTTIIINPTHFPKTALDG